MSPEEAEARAERIRAHLNCTPETALELAYRIGDTPILSGDGREVLIISADGTIEQMLPASVAL